MKEILEKEQTRLANVLTELDPLREVGTYTCILDNLATVTSLLVDPVKPCGCDQPIGFTAPEPYVEITPFPEPSTEEYTAPVMSDTQVGIGLNKDKLDYPPTEEPGKTYTKEEVRAALAKARKKGVNVTEFLGEFGAENFTGLPAAQYPEVMAKLEAL